MLATSRRSTPTPISGPAQGHRGTCLAWGAERDCWCLQVAGSNKRWSHRQTVDSLVQKTMMGAPREAGAGNHRQVLSIHHEDGLALPLFVSQAAHLIVQSPPKRSGRLGTPSYLSRWHGEF